MDMEYTKKVDEEATSLLPRVLISCFVKGDEAESRCNILKTISNVFDKCPDAFKKDVLNRVLGKTNEMSFLQLSLVYDLAVKNHEEGIKIEDYIIEDSDMEGNRKLFSLVFKSPNNSMITIFENGEDSVQVKKIKSFEFEGSYYAFILDSDGEYRYYKYMLTELDGEIQEKLVPVYDDMKLEFFEFLGL